MCHRNGQGDVAHTFTTDFLFRDFNTATVTHDAFVANTLVFAAMTFPILDRTEDALTEESIALRLIGTVVDRFRLQHLTT